MDAFPIQQTGQSTSVEEVQRQLVDSLYASTGRVDGLAVSGTTTGASALTVTPGWGIVQLANGRKVVAGLDVAETATLSVSSQPSGSRTDHVYLDVNDTNSNLVAAGIADVLPGKSYVAVGSGATPSGTAVRLATLVVTGTSIVVTADPARAELRSVYGRYASTFEADVLPAGTAASVPTAPSHVATMGYVDGRDAQSHWGWRWGGLSGYGPVPVPNGSFNKLPGSVGRVDNVKAGHLYQIHAMFTPKALNSQNNILMRAAIWVGTSAPPVNSNGAGAISQHDIVCSSTVPNASGLNESPVNLMQHWRCPADGTYYFGILFATNSPGNVGVHNRWDSPYIEVTDQGYVLAAGPAQVL